MPMRGLQPTNNSFLLLPGGDKRSIALAGWLLLMVLAAGCGSLRGQDLVGGSALQGIERIPFDLDRFAQQSDVIVHGVVSSKEARWVDRTLYTHYRLVVRETIQGDARSSITVSGARGNAWEHCSAHPGCSEPACRRRGRVFRTDVRRTAEFQTDGLGRGGRACQSWNRWPVAIRSSAGKA